MKTILNIILILLVAAVVAGGFYLVVNNTSIASGPGGEGGQPPSMTGSEGARPERPEGMSEGGEHGASVGQGLIQVLVTLAKLAAITVVVLLAEKGISLVSKKRTAAVA